MRNRLAPEPGPVLSVTADYALRAILALARAGGSPLAAPRIAAITGAPGNYMSKTLNALARAGLLRSRRGPAGGFTLALPVEQITVRSIADVFAEPRPRTRCLLGDRPCDPRTPCAVHERWTAVVEATRAPLAVTIAGLLADDPLAAAETAGATGPRLSHPVARRPRRPPPRPAISLHRPGESAERTSASPRQTQPPVKA